MNLFALYAHHIKNITRCSQEESLGLADSLWVPGAVPSNVKASLAGYVGQGQGRGKFMFAGSIIVPYSVGGYT